MITVNEKSKCSGCAACFNSCPVNAIKMEPDDEGFLYPHVDQEICIRCNQCNKSCPYENKPIKEIDLELCYAAYNRDDAEREISSSGGIFIALAKHIVAQRGIVFGAAFDEKFLVYHKSAETYEELQPLIGSKYLQSKIGDTYRTVKTMLMADRKVLFVGTGCQIGGLLGYLRKDYDNLICVDFICLGVPSPKVWKDYLNFHFKGEEIKCVNFKDKTLGWHNFSLKVVTDKKVCITAGRKTEFFSGYFRHLISRPSCSSCIFKEGNRLSDITISDCWGYHTIAPEIDDNKGLSSIVCHSEKGKAIFEEIKNGLIWKETKIEDVRRFNSNYYLPAKKVDNREDFWKDYERMESKALFKKYCKPVKDSKITMYVKRIKDKVKRVLNFESR